MSGYNLPPGCMDASDLDYYDRVNRIWCEDKAEGDPDFCEHCGAMRNEDCKPDCDCGACCDQAPKTEAK